MESMPITELHQSYAPILAERLARRSLVTPTGCVEWTGARDRDGYGKITVKTGMDGARRQTGAHRAAWLVLHSIENPALVLDHLCRNRACVNTDHLELVTNRENVLRGDGSTGRPRGGPTKAQSCRTHGREDGYEAPIPGGYLRWVCRPCRKARMAKWRDRRK